MASSLMTSNGYVWVEKYRPGHFEDILFPKFAVLWTTWHW